MKIYKCVSAEIFIVMNNKYTHHMGNTEEGDLWRHLTINQTFCVKLNIETEAWQPDAIFPEIAAYI